MRHLIVNQKKASNWFPMLQIRLNKGGSSGDAGGGVTAMSRSSNPSETVMVACPDHLILADLPVAKSLGMPPSSNALSVVAKSLGRRSRRNLGERVHFCVACDFPISIYGRLVCFFKFPLFPLSLYSFNLTFFLLQIRFISSIYFLVSFTTVF